MSHARPFSPRTLRPVALATLAHIKKRHPSHPAADYSAPHSPYAPSPSDSSCCDPGRHGHHILRNDHHIRHHHGSRIRYGNRSHQLRGNRSRRRLPSGRCSGSTRRRRRSSRGARSAGRSRHCCGLGGGRCVSRGGRAFLFCLCASVLLARLVNPLRTVIRHQKRPD